MSWYGSVSVIIIIIIKVVVYSLETVQIAKYRDSANFNHVSMY